MKTKLNYVSINNKDDIQLFIDEAYKTKNRKSKYEVTLRNIPELDSELLRSLSRAIEISGVSIVYKIAGNINLYAAALLNSRFKRIGYKGDNINLSIPTNASITTKDDIIDRLSKYVKDGYTTTIQSLINGGKSISMKDAEIFGLITKEVDPDAKKRGKQGSTTGTSSGSGAGTTGTGTTGTGTTGTGTTGTGTTGTGTTGAPNDSSNK